MSSNNNLHHIEYLTGVNYPIWQTMMKMILIEKGYWSIVNGTYSRPIVIEVGEGTAKEIATRDREVKEWDTTAEKAVAAIILCIDFGQLV